MKNKGVQIFVAAAAELHFVRAATKGDANNTTVCGIHLYFKSSSSVPVVNIHKKQQHESSDRKLNSLKRKKTTWSRVWRRRWHLEIFTHTFRPSGRGVHAPHGQNQLQLQHNCVHKVQETPRDRGALWDTHFTLLPRSGGDGVSVRHCITQSLTQSILQRKDEEQRGGVFEAASPASKTPMGEVVLHHHGSPLKEPLSPPTGPPDLAYI